MLDAMSLPAKLVSNPKPTHDDLSKDTKQAFNNTAMASAVPSSSSPSADALVVEPSVAQASQLIQQVREWLDEFSKSKEVVILDGGFATGASYGQRRGKGLT